MVGALGTREERVTSLASLARYLSNRIAKRLLSRQRWLILWRKTSSVTDTCEDSGLTVREAEASDIDRLARSLPLELVAHLPKEKVHSMVASRFRSGMPCFVVYDSDTLLAGCWCPVSQTGPHLSINNAAEITTLFVTPEARGRGISTLLCRHVCDHLYRKGVQNCVSLVWYSRPASIKTHLNADFVPVGEKVTWSLLGLRWTRFNRRLEQRG